MNQKGNMTTMTAKEEAITKAAQAATMLLSDVRQAHKTSCDDDPVLEMLLRDILAETAKLEAKLNQLDACFR
jgi:hypothetical protein